MSMDIYIDGVGMDTRTISGTVFRFYGNVDDHLIQYFSCAMAGSYSYSAGGYNSALNSGASGAGLTYNVTQEDGHGDLYGTISMNPLNIYGLMGKSMTSFSLSVSSGRNSVWISQTPTAANGWIGAVTIYDPDGSEGYYDFSVSMTMMGKGYLYFNGNIFDGEVLLPTNPINGSQTFTSSGTFTVPANVYKINVQGAGGGGGGGGGGQGSQNNAGTSGGGGGGGGASYYSNAYSISVTPGQTFSVTIGAGGSGGSGTWTNFQCGGNGGSGGTTSFVGNGYNYSWAGGAGGTGGDFAQGCCSCGGGGGGAGAASGQSAGAGGDISNGCNGDACSSGGSASGYVFGMNNATGGSVSINYGTPSGGAGGSGGPNIANNGANGGTASVTGNTTSGASGGAGGAGALIVVW